MKTRRASWLIVLAVLTLAVTHRESSAQYPTMGSTMVPPMPTGYMPAGGGGMYGYAPSPYAPSPYAPGMLPVIPANYMYGDSPEAVEETPCSCSDCQSGMDYCDCDECCDEPGVLFGHGRGHKLVPGLGRWLGCLLPYPGGGCCTPHWFDVHAEVVMLGRADTDEPYWEFSRLGATGPAVITSDDVALDEYQPSLRISLAHQTGPGSNLEFTYFGLNDYSETASAYSADDQLYAVFDNFSLDATGNPDPSSEIEQLHQAEFQEVQLSSDFDSLELNYRRRWTGPSCLVQGSWLMGVRFVDLSDQLTFYSFASRDTAPPAGEDNSGGEARYVLKARNYMTGCQLGGDMWFCLLPGLRFGLDAKGGIFGNNAKADTSMVGRDLFDQFVGFVDPERLNNDTVSFIGEGSLLLTYAVNHNITLRGGYQLLYFNGVSTGLGNFNPTITGRIPVMDNGTNVLYDGFNAGFEWMW